MIALAAEAESAARSNMDTLRERMAMAWRPIEEPDVVDWVTGCLRFGPGDSGVQLESRVGAFTYDDSPWWQDILRTAVDRRVSSVALPAATQVHKTANFLIAVPLFFAEFRPAPGMIVVPDELEAKKIRDRIYSVVQESRKFHTFHRIRIPPKHKWNLQEIDLGSMVIHLAWAGSRQRTRGKPCYYVWFTEIDVFPDADQKAGDAVEAGKQRTKDVFRYKHFFESSPSEAPSKICDEERLADQRLRWHCRCPHCGTRQEPRFFRHKKGEHAGRGGIDFTVRAAGGDGDSLLTPRQAREHAHYVCVNGCKIHNDRKQQWIESGEWLPLGWKEGDPEPGYSPQKNEGRHLWAIHSPNETFGTIAEDYLRHLAKGRKVDFYGNRLAIAYQAESRAPAWSELGKKAAGHHARRTVPSEAWFLTAGIDKQGENNGSRYVVRAWAPHRTSWLVDWGWVERDPNDTALILSDLSTIERDVVVGDFAVVDRDNNPAINPLGHSRLRSRLSAIDTNHLPMQIHRWMRQLPEEYLDRMDGDRLVPGRVRAIRGDPKVKPDVRFRHNLVETNVRSGEKYEGGLHQWGVCVYPYYSDLLDAISGQIGPDGNWFVTSDCLAKGREYLEQVTNFHYAITVDPRRGKRGKWGPKSGRIPVDFWDCEIYAAVAAEMVVGNLGWEPAAWESWRNHQQAPPRTPPNRPRRSVDEIGAR
ncbi:MAG: terminase gpA endonuclease subunit [Planctomycetota bacterium]